VHPSLDVPLHAHIITLHLFDDGTQRHQQLGARITSAVSASSYYTAATGSIMEVIPDSASNENGEPQISTSQAIRTQVPPLSAFRHKPLSDDEEAQVQRIINAAETRDWHALGRLAASPGGFIDDEVRRIVCMCKQRCCQLPPIAVLTDHM
jgi:hypothetical protein